MRNDDFRKSVLSTFGDNLRQRRLSANLSQEELGAMAGLDRTFISGIERGVRNPSLTIVAKIAIAFKIPISTLLEST